MKSKFPDEVEKSDGFVLKNRIAGINIGKQRR
jgi:hypothetical protein